MVHLNSIKSVIDLTQDMHSNNLNKIKIIEKTFEANSFFQDISLKFKYQVTKKGLKYVSNIDSYIPEILYGDEIRIRQILNEILKNILEYTENGYVEFEVQSIILEKICRLFISFKDSGKGIIVSALNLLDEEPVKIVEQKVSDFVDLQNLVNLMGGIITINGQQNVGNTYNLILDQRIVDNKTIDKYVSSYKKGANDKCISIISNNKETKKFFYDVLKDSYDVYLFDNLEEMDDELLSISDYALLIIDGSDEEIKNIKSFKNGPIIQCSKLLLEIENTKKSRVFSDEKQKIIKIIEYYIDHYRVG